LNKAIDEL
jgi:hypothetical protein